MDSEDLRDKMIEITIGEKQYALLPLCAFQDIKSTDNNGIFKFKTEIIEEQFGLKDTMNTMSIFEITDLKKIIMAKIKYGI
jgi:hypothetical protein